MTGRTCRGCGQGFFTDDLRRRYCDTCRPPELRAKHAAAVAKHRASHITDSRAYQNQWYQNHKDLAYAARIRSYTRTCITCGATRLRSDLTKAETADFICGECKTAERKSNRKVQQLHACPYCGNVTYENLYCEDCAGLQANVALELGLSRERVRQLMNQLLARVPGLTKRAALEYIRMERKVVA